MTEEASFGVRRLRQAIANQATCGSGRFELSIDSADKLCRECEDELLEICSSANREIGRYAWAHGVPAPVDTDGRVVPVTMRVMYTGEGEMVDVERITFNGSSWHAWDSGGVYRLGTLHLNRPDSWEKLEEGIRKAAHGGSCGYFDKADKPCREGVVCPADCVPDKCAVVALRDVMRRAKALAERDAKITSKD